jgi:hypothetical protein
MAKYTHVEKGLDLLKQIGVVNRWEYTPITEQTFIDCDFKRTDVSMEESGEDAPSHYYTFDFGSTYDPTLMSNEDFTGVNIFNLTEDYKTWKTEGELQLLFLLFLKEEKTT